jgi:multicomponent Na+:H+ antiporter subunit B
MKKTDILDVIARKLSPFILLFGCYVIAYGHLSPGGGFQGGVVLASGVILLVLCQDVNPIQALFPLPAVSLVESLGFMLFLVIGIVGLVVGGHFLVNFLPVGKVGEVPSAGFIFLLNIIVGLKVGAGITLMCFYLFREEL